MKQNYSNSIFLGGAFREHQILFMLPILDGICKRHKIKKIVFEKDFSKKIKKEKALKNLFKNYQIETIQNIKDHDKSIFNYIVSFSWIVYFFLKSFFISRSKLLSKKNDWYTCQVNHSIWDTCIINNKKKLNKFEIISRLKSSIFLSRQIYKHKILKKLNVICAVIQHTVYEERFLLALMRRSKIQIFVQTKHVLIKQKLNEDYGFKHLDRNIFFDSYKIFNKNKINNYWKNQYLKGKPKYLEAKIASNIKDQNKFDFNKKENVLMLHIFKDSPFTNIDRSRIFADYYSWVINTLKIISKSNEKWIIRKHPSADKWGEDQTYIVNEILNTIFNYQIPNNIFFENNIKSNITQFKMTNKIVTFSGNSHLEAGCFGIKPIIISKTTLNNFDDNLYFKPKSIKQYENILLEKNTKKFKLSKSQIEKCKRMLYCIHNVINYAEDVSSHHVFRNENKKIFDILFRKISKKVNENYNSLYDIGFYLGKKYDQSINKRYFEKFFYSKS